MIDFLEARAERWEVWAAVLGVERGFERGQWQNGRVVNISEIS